MNRTRFLAILMALSMVVMPMVASSQSAAAQDDDIKIAYILHGLNDFTQTIKEGAEDAGEDLGVTVDVFGEAGFDIPTHQAFLESAIQAGYDGIAVIPNGGDPWNTLLQEASDAGIPLATANNTALNSVVDLWVGQDEYNSGILVAQEMQKQLAAKDVTSGKIVIGSCFPGNPVLDDRSAGIHSVFDGTDFELTQDYDTKLDNTENYNIWDSLATANPDAVAMIGLCSLDPPNMAQVKERGGYEWLAGGYDLETPTLQAIQDGYLAVSAGQQPYLQGYLPVLALVQEIREGTHISGWLEVPTDLVTAENVEDFMPRESDAAVQREFYAKYIAEHFADLAAAARPYSDLSAEHGAAASPEATPAG
ncbi:MAG TPA: sugar ABC transporter substrate-binding protein [Thermomicrobiales bacterium]|nr:sugar ABC transporter substrate-binding protein [Thermomicrobiales bacterium]